MPQAESVQFNAIAGGSGSNPGSDYEVAGQLRFSNVNELLQNSQSIFSQGSGKITINLSRISHSDSAGLALLTEWMRCAKRQGREIAFLNIPRQMLEIARASGLDDILPLARA